MYYNGNKAENLKIAYIGGGSRGWAWGLMSVNHLDRHSISYTGFGNNYEDEWVHVQGMNSKR